MADQGGLKKFGEGDKATKFSESRRKSIIKSTSGSKLETQQKFSGSVDDLDNLDLADFEHKKEGEEDAPLNSSEQLDDGFGFGGGFEEPEEGQTLAQRLADPRATLTETLKRVGFELADEPDDYRELESTTGNKTQDAINDLVSMGLMEPLDVSKFLGVDTLEGRRGWMNKVGERGRTFVARKSNKFRFFVLEGTRLTYYKDEDPDAEPLGTIDMSQVTNVVGDDDNPESTVVTIVTKDKTHHMTTKTAEDCKDWLAVLRKAHLAAHEKAK